METSLVRRIEYRKKLDDVRLNLIDSKPKKEQLQYIYHLILN